MNEASTARHGSVTVPESGTIGARPARQHPDPSRRPGAPTQRSKTRSAIGTVTRQFGRLAWTSITMVGKALWAVIAFILDWGNAILDAISFL